MAETIPATAPESEGPPRKAKTDADIIAEARERLKRCIDENSIERTKQKDDLVFSMLEQWPSDIKSARENDPNGSRPCLVIDQINQYIGQVVNDLKQNRPAVKIRPNDDKADVKTAQVFQGLIRHIEDKSVAQVAYMTAADSAVRMGEGYFRVVTEYESEMSFDQVIKIKEIPDMFAVYLGPHVSPTGSDAEYGFVFVDTPTSVFRRNWPKAKYQSVEFDELQDFKGNWYFGDGDDPRIRVAEYFYYDYSEPFEIYFLPDGSVVRAKDYTGTERIPDDRKRMTRTRSVKWCKLTGAEVLEKRDWAGKYIPIVKVTGKQSWIDGKRSIWGLVRPAKDALRMYNYIASTIVEKFALAPKAPLIGAKGQFEGVEDRWQSANRINYSYLEYNPISVDGQVVPAPERSQPAPIEAALYQFMETCKEGVQASLAMFKASLGKEQPNQSGKAILALTRESDTGTFHFADNTALAIQHCGTILVDLAPKIYDTKRVLKITGEDGKVQTVELDPSLPTASQETESGVPSIYNLSVGDYDVTATVGPSYNTMRMEAATLFTDLANSSKDPMSAAVMRYLAVKYSDMPHADVASEMLEKLLPPGVAPARDGEQPIPPEVAQKMAQMEEAGNELVQENEELKSGVREAEMKIQAQHDAKMKELDLKRLSDEAEAELAKQKARRELELKEWVAKEELRIEEEAARRKADLEEKKAADAHAVALKKASTMPAATA